MDFYGPRGVELLIIAPDTLSVLGADGGFKSYSSVVGAAREVVRSALEEFVRSTRPELGFFRYSIEVVPGVGRYDDVTFLGHLYILYFHVYLAIVDAALRVLGRYTGGIDVWLDLTHGVNYLPSVVLLAARDAVAALRLAGVDAGLLVVNSDPYPVGKRGADCNAGVGELPSLRVNVIPVEFAESPLHIGDVDRNYRVYSVFGEKARKELRIWDRRVYKTLFRLNRLVRAVAMSIRHSLPLVLSNVLPQLEGWDTLSTGLLGEVFHALLSDLRRSLDYSAKVSCNGGCIVDTREALEGEEAVRSAITYTKLLALAIGVADRLKALNCASAESVPAKCLRRVVEEVIAPYNTTAKHFVSRELAELAATVRKAAERGEELGKWRTWRSIKPLGRVEEVGDIDSILAPLELRYRSDVKHVIESLFNDRNFLAHAGLRYDLVELRLKDYINP